MKMENAAAELTDQSAVNSPQTPRPTLRHPRTLPHSTVCTYNAQEARTPNRSQRVFV